MIYHIHIDKQRIGSVDLPHDTTQSQRDEFKEHYAEMAGVRPRHVRLVPQGQNSHLKGKKYADTVNGRVYF
jgi:hypothetical protein